MLVDGYAVERLVRNFRQQFGERSSIDRGVGGDVGEHCGHVGGDHAGAFAVAGDGDLFAGETEGGVGGFGDEVGGENALGEGFAGFLGVGEEVEGLAMHGIEEIEQIATPRALNVAQHGPEDNGGGSLHY